MNALIEGEIVKEDEAAGRRKENGVGLGVLGRGKKKEMERKKEEGEHVGRVRSAQKIKG